MNAIFNKFISSVVFAALIFSFTLSVEAAGPEQLGGQGQISQPSNQMKVQPTGQQQQPTGQNQMKGQVQPVGQQPKGQNQSNQPSGQQAIGQNQQVGQSFGKQSTVQNQTGGQGQSVGQQQSGQNQQKAQGQFGQPAGSPTMGQNQPKGQSQFSQPSGQQPNGQGQSFGQQGQGQFGGQNQLGQQSGQLKSQPMGQQQQLSGQNQFDGQEQFGQPGSQQPSDQNQNFGQQPLAEIGQTESGQATEQEQVAQESINFKSGLFGNIGNKVFKKFKSIFNSNEQPADGQQQLQGQPMGQQQVEQGLPLGQGQFLGQQPAGQMGQALGQMNEKQQAFINQYEKKKEAYQEQIQTQEAARQHFLELRDEFSNSEEPEKQEETKMLMTKQVQKYLENTAETMIKRVENLEERVSEMPKLPVAGKEKITAELNQDAAWLNDKLVEAKNTNDAAALKEIAEDIRGYWKDHDLKVKQIVGYTILGKIDAVAEKAENMADVVESKLEELKTKGLDVANAEKYLEEYHDMIDAAKQKRAEAESKFSGKDSAQAFQEGMKIVQGTKGLFIDVRDKMKDVLGEIKTLSKNSKAIKEAPKQEDVEAENE